MPVENTCRHVRRESQRNAGTIRVCLLNVSCCGVRGLTSSPLTEVSAPNEKPMCSEPSSRMSFTGRIPSAFLGQWSRDAGQGVAQCGGLVLHKSFLRMVVWICRTYENVEREAALAPGLRDFFRSCAVWRLTKMDRIFPSTVVRVRSLTFGGAGEELCLLSLLLLFVVTPLDSSE